MASTSSALPRTKGSITHQEPGHTYCYRCRMTVPEGAEHCPFCGCGRCSSHDVLCLHPRHTEQERKGREFTTEERIIGANSQRTARMERALHAWALRREGLTIYEIARCLGVTRQTVHRYLRQHEAIMEEAQGVREQMADVGAVTSVGSTRRSNAADSEWEGELEILETAITRVAAPQRFDWVAVLRRQAAARRADTLRVGGTRATASTGLGWSAGVSRGRGDRTLYMSGVAVPARP